MSVIPSTSTGGVPTLSITPPPTPNPLLPPVTALVANCISGVFPSACSLSAVCGDDVILTIPTELVTVFWRSESELSDLGVTSRTFVVGMRLD